MSWRGDQYTKLDLTRVQWKIKQTDKVIVFKGWLFTRPDRFDGFCCLANTLTNTTFRVSFASFTFIRAYSRYNIMDFMHLNS